MIECGTLGPIAITVDGAPAPTELTWRKHFAVLIYLARSPRRTRARDQILDLLWGGRPESAGRHSLNEALRIIRRAAGPDAIATSAGYLRLADSAVRLDVDRLEELRSNGQWADACTLIRGEFLEGFSVPDASPFEDWLSTERRWWRQHSVDALLHWHSELLHGGNVFLALDAAQRAAVLDPDSDLAARAVMAGRALSDDPAGALAYYEAFATALGQRLQAKPSAETQAFADRIRRGHRARMTAPVPTRHPTTRRAPLVGRQSGLQEMVVAWRNAAAGRATLVILEGDIGTGKTRMIDELRKRAVLDGASSALVRAVESDLTQPGSALLGLAAGGLLDTPGLSTASPRALAAFCERIPEWADQFPASRTASGADPLSQAFPEILAAVTAEAPGFLAVDDAQWADRESLLTLGAVLRTLAQRPLLVVLAVGVLGPREDIDRLRSQLGRDLNGASIPLPALEEPAVRRLAAWALPSYDDDQLDRVTRRVFADSGGFPLLAVELLHAVSIGLTLEAGSVWPRSLATLSETLPSDLPDNVVAALRVGYRRLSKTAQSVLGAAAVLGPRVTEAQLARGVELPEAELHVALDELEWNRWLVSDSRGYSFLARICQDVIARDFMTPGQQRRLRARMNPEPT